MSAECRVVVVGTGFGARVVAPVFAATEGFEVAAVVSARDDAAVRTAIQAAEGGLVSVHSPPFLHATHTRWALEAGCSVLCDKPLSAGAATSHEMTEEAAAAGACALVNFEFRWSPARRAVRDLLRDGSIGTVEHVVWTHLTSGSRHPLRRYGWLFDRSLGGGWIGAWASHAVDTLRFWLGEVDAVEWTRPRTTITRRPDAGGTLHDCDAEDGVSALLRMGNGARVLIDSSFAASASLPARIVIAGSEGMISLTGERTVALHRDGEPPRELAPPAAAPGVDPHLAPMQAQAEAVRRRLLDGEYDADLAGFADGYAVDVVLDAMRSPAR